MSSHEYAAARYAAVKARHDFETDNCIECETLYILEGSDAAKCEAHAYSCQCGKCDDCHWAIEPETERPYREPAVMGQTQLERIQAVAEYAHGVKGNMIGFVEIRAIGPRTDAAVCRKNGCGWWRRFNATLVIESKRIRFISNRKAVMMIAAMHALTHNVGSFWTEPLLSPVGPAIDVDSEISEGRVIGKSTKPKYWTEAKVNNLHKSAVMRATTETRASLWADMAARTCPTFMKMIGGKTQERSACIVGGYI